MESSRQKLHAALAALLASELPKLTAYLEQVTPEERREFERQLAEFGITIPSQS